MVKEENFYLAAVVGVDDAGAGVYEVLRCKTAPGGDSAV